MKKNSLLVVLIVLSFFISRAQSPEEVYRQPLKTVLDEVERTFGVKLVYEDKNVQNRFVDYADWRFTRDVTGTLENILKPLDMVYKEKEKGVFEITRYEYYRRTEKEGAEHLKELEALYNTSSGFDKRRANLRNAILNALGINPQAARNPLHPIMTAKRKMKGYTVQNIALESVPGYYLTGSLYMPSKIRGRAPVILCPHGHFYNKTDPSIPNERGRYRPDMQYRCATLAKMGAIVLSYDMYSYGESVLQSGNRSWHRSGFALAMQTWNSIRALDFLLSLPQADETRVGITGASGGGTQTFLLAALDDRVTASAPVVMVSSSFFGGCPCESGLPIHGGCEGHRTNNAEIAAMFAPKPQLVVSDGNDWTKSVPGTDYPFLRYVYGLYGKKEAVANVHLQEDQHDYSYTKRVPVYKFFAMEFGLDLKTVTNGGGGIDETGVSIEPAERLYVFGPDGKLPGNTLRSHEAIVEAFKKLQGVLPK
jgi:hypothetical protein